jgi:hypothetical protein
LNGIADSVDRLPFFRSPAVAAVLTAIATDRPSLYSAFLAALFARGPSPALWFAVAAGGDVGDPFVAPAAALLDSHSVPTALFFLRRAPPAPALIAAAFREFDEEPAAVLDVADAYALSGAADFIVPHLPTVMAFINSSNGRLLQRALILLFRTLDLLSDDARSYVASRVADACDPDHISDFADFLAPIIAAMAPATPAAFRHSLGDAVLVRIAPIALSDDADSQSAVSLVISVLLGHDCVRDRSAIGAWASSAIRIRPVRRHFAVLEMLADLFPIPGVVEFIADWDFAEAPAIGGCIVELLSAVAWTEFIPMPFMIALLAAPTIPALNGALDLFRDVTCGQTTQELAVVIVDAIFAAMGRLYFRRQIGVALAIVANVVGGRAIDVETVRELFLRNFRGEWPGIAEFADAIRAPQFGEFVVEAADRLWEIVAGLRAMADEEEGKNNKE